MPHPPSLNSPLRPSRLSVRAFQTFLRRNRLFFACAESCTGGLLARQMTARAGSSEVFWGGAVTYSDDSKTKLLGVPAELIAAHGAVSGPVAEAMVRGIVSVSRAPLAVSITGIAGPGGGSPSKPVGTVWYGLAAVKAGSASVAAVRAQMDGGRGEIQRQAAVLALGLAKLWWDSDMDLDSLRSLADNDDKSSLEAFQPPLFIPPHFP